MQTYTLLQKLKTSYSLYLKVLKIIFYLIVGIIKSIKVRRFFLTASLNMTIIEMQLQLNTTTKESDVLNF